MPTEFSNYIEARPSATADGTELLVASKDGEAVQLTAQQIADLGGGGGDVDSVNGQTGVVVLDAGDVGADPAGSAATVATNLTNHINDTTDAHDASAISFAPAGNIAATDVQAAIEELDGEKMNDGMTYRTLTANHTLDATDLASVNGGNQLTIIITVAVAGDLNIPTNATQAFPVGTIIGFEQGGAGQLTVVPAGTVTLRSPNNANKTYAQYSKAYIEKLATNEWLLSGDITV